LDENVYINLYMPLRRQITTSEAFFIVITGRR